MKKINKEEIEIEKKLAKQRERHFKRVTAYQKAHKNDVKIAPEGSFISLQHINKIYSNHVQAVFDFNLEIKEKEFIVFVGPSGCGKSTTLRMIAGLEDITSGDLYIDGTYANYLEPKDRDVAMVFQSYALYPHMTVYDNMAFGLHVKHLPKEEIDARVHKAARILEIEEYLDRKPKALSGGQCQRVALGRAIVRNAKVFLMDEPLSNLDAKLRVQMRSELVNLHNELGATTIYVTHDQTEAMTMASRIVIMNKGVIQQIGTPKEIYNNPTNVFVATFIGSPAMNILKATYSNDKIIFANNFVLDIDENIKQAHDNFYTNEIEHYNNLIEQLSNNENKDEDQIQEDLEKQEEIKKIITNLIQIKTSSSHEIIIGIRPEDVLLNNYNYQDRELTTPFESEVKVVELLGNEYHIHSKFANENIISKAYANVEIKPNEIISLSFDKNKIHIFDNLTKKRII